jgi:hypothetical protein
MRIYRKRPCRLYGLDGVQASMARVRLNWRICPDLKGKVARKRRYPIRLMFRSTRRFAGDRAGRHIKRIKTKENHAMKLNMKLTRKICEDLASGATKTTQRVNKPETSAKAGVAKRFRRLKWNELVSPGDFVADEHRGFEPWEGPSGFLANAFVKPIYQAGRKPFDRNQTIKMNRSRCPHCGVKPGNSLYADACPHCHEQLKHNTRPLSTPKQNSRKAKAWLVQMFSRLLLLAES